MNISFFTDVMLSRACRCVAVAGFALCSDVWANEEVLVDPTVRGVRIDRFFYDFKSPSAPKRFDEARARKLLIDYNFNGIRTSIYGTASKPAHPGPGVIDEKLYEHETTGLKLAKRIRPDTVIFASKKLDGPKSFPDWTKDGKGVIPEKYAVLVADYLDYMKRQGLDVDVLGIDNERCFNEGQITPDKHRDIVLELRRLARERGFHMPKIIGPEDFTVGRDEWMETLRKRRWGDTLDIYGTHYYPNARKLERLESDIKEAGKREKWHTELHWDTDEKGDPMQEAVAAILALWDCTDNGMNGLMWWAFSDGTSFRGSLMKALSVPLVGAWPVKVVSPDGSETVDEKKLHARAFLQGDQLTIYVLNLDPAKKWEGLLFKLADGQMVGLVEGRQWAKGYPSEGVELQFEPDTSREFRVDLMPGTISVFGLKVKL